MTIIQASQRQSNEISPRPYGVTPASELRDAAVGYARRGWSVIPLRPRDKRPAVASWEKWQHERADADGVARYWTKHPQANVGIVTGHISRLLVVDVDGPEGRESIRSLGLPVTPVVETGKGWHYYLAHPGGRVPNAVGLLPGVDVRGDGGYVVAVPSVHPSGRRYRWADGLSPDDVDLAPCPEWLLNKLRDRSPVPSRTPEEWRRLVGAGVEEGKRNSSAASLAGMLLRRGVDPYVALDLLLCWNAQRCRPPLPEGELVRTFESIAALELRRRGGGRNAG